VSCGNIFERTFLHQRQRLIGACRACSLVLSVCLGRLWRRALCRQRLAAVAEKPASSPLIPAKPPIQPVRVRPRRRCAAPWRSYGVCSRSLDAVLAGCAPVATPPRQSQTVTRRHAARVDDGVVLRRPADRRVNGGRRQGCHVPTTCAGRWVEVGRSLQPLAGGDRAISLRHRHREGAPLPAVGGDCRGGVSCRRRSAVPVACWEHHP